MQALMPGEEGQQVKIGIGKIDFHTYCLTIKDESGNVLWEGTINGQPFTGPDGLPALRPREIPRDLAQVLQRVKVYHSEWKPAWEVVEDGDNETSSQGD